MKAAGLADRLHKARSTYSKDHLAQPWMLFLHREASGRPVNRGSICRLAQRYFSLLCLAMKSRLKQDLKINRDWEADLARADSIV